MKSLVAWALWLSLSTLSLPATSGADQPWQEKEPESVQTVCQRDPEPSKCVARMQKVMESYDKPPESGAAWVGLLAIVAPLLVLWFILSRK